MDFTFTPEQDEAAALAAKILDAECTPDRLRDLDRSAAAEDGPRFDRRLWAALGEAGLVGLHLPSEYGGAGLGLIELARVLEEAGRRVAAVPLATHGAASAVLAEVGPDDLRASWLPGATDGTRLLAVALGEDHDAVPAPPTVRAEPVDGQEQRWRLTGVKTQVRAGTLADAFLVTASTTEGPGLFLVTPGEGVEIVSQRLIDGDLAGRLVLQDAPARRVGGAEAVERLAQVASACTAAEQLGVIEGALAETADYARTREQFARPIGSFQAVSQRLADGYIDTLCLRLAAWQAVWRLSEHLPAAVEVATAQLWAADAGHRLAHTAVHVHGGVGIDLDGVTHRFFTAAKRLEFAHGGATAQALSIGRRMAAERG